MDTRKDHRGRRTALWTGLALAMLLPSAFAAEVVAAAGDVPAKDVAADEAPKSGKAGKRKEVVLPKTRVTAVAPGGYGSGRVTIGKQPLTVRETPQAVTVITRQRLDDQNLNSVPDALKQATGVTVRRFDGAGNFNNYFVRGYQVDAIQLDGLNFGNSGNVVEFDTAMYDRIEILRGPAGIFQGSGEPGAVINLVRKRALPTTRFGAAVNTGSWDAYRAEVDATGALAAEGALRGRVAAAYDHRNSYQDIVGSERQMVYGTLEYDFSPTTTLSAGIAWQDIDAVIDQGLPAYANGELLDVPRSTFIGARWNQQKLESTDIFAELEHALDNGGLVKVAARHLDRYMFYRVARANSAVDANGTTAIQAGEFSPDRENWSADAYASVPFDAFDRTHNVIFGMDWRQQEESSESSAFGNLPTRFNVFEPNNDIPLPAFPITSVSGIDTTQYGVYSQLRFKAAETLTLVGGGRLSWWESQSKNLLTGATTADYDEEAELTPYAALLWDVHQKATLYASFAEVFQPQNNVDVDNGQLPPRTGRQIEMGVKAELVENVLDAQFAVFQINDRNRALAAQPPLPPGAPPNATVASGEVENQGFELELTGRLLPGWDLTAGYAYVDTEFVRGTAAQTGNAFDSATPRHNVNLWTRYQFDEGAMKGFHVGGGVKAVSEFYTGTGALRFVEDGYTVVSAQAGYRFSANLDASLTANNLFDEKYYEKVSGAGRQNFYGEPRSYMVSLRATF